MAWLRNKPDDIHRTENGRSRQIYFVDKHLETKADSKSGESKMGICDERTQYITWAVVVLVAVAGTMIGLTIGLRTPPLENGGSPPELRPPESPEEKPWDSVYREFKSAAVTTDTNTCSPIASEILAVHGGSAVDAAIAAALCVGVINHHSGGIGGGFFATIYDTPRNGSSKMMTTILSREVAPLAAYEDMYVNDTQASRKGGLSIAVPGEVAGYYEMWRQFGRVDWALLFEPSIKLCEEGFPVERSLAGAVRSYELAIKLDQNLREIFVKENGNLVQEGDTIVNEKLAETLRRIAADPFTFYNGSLADDIVADIAEYGGIITKEDLEIYQPKMKAPLRTIISTGELTLYTPRPPSSGAVISFIMNIIDGYNFNRESVSKTEDTVLTYHRITEAFKFAYAKRSRLGDEDFVDVQDLLLNLTSDDYAEGIRAQITDDTTHDYKYYGPTFDIDEDAGTAHMNVLAPDGSAVALTNTINLFFGSNVRGSRTGILFNDEMDDFSTPGSSNAFGVPGSPSNYIVPGKMPMSSMTPSLLLDNENRVRMLSGASGGTRITTSTAFVTAGSLWLGRDLKESTDAARVHHQLLPDEIVAEDYLDEKILEGLRQKNHEIVSARSIAVVGSILNTCHYENNETRKDRQLESGCIQAVSDARKGGSPDGF